VGLHLSLAQLQEIMERWWRYDNHTSKFQVLELEYDPAVSPWTNKKGDNGSDYVEYSGSVKKESNY
jgi:hypothetical protein